MAKPVDIAGLGANGSEEGGEGAGEGRGEGRAAALADGRGAAGQGARQGAAREGPARAEAGPAAEGTLLTFGPDPAKKPTAKKFLDAYRAKYGPHGPYAIYGYDAANILLQAIEKTGSTKYQALADYLHNTEFQTAMGPLRFDQKGDITDTYYVMWVVKDGKFVLYEDAKL